MKRMAHHAKKFRKRTQYTRKTRMMAWGRMMSPPSRPRMGPRNAGRLPDRDVELDAGVFSAESEGRVAVGHVGQARVEPQVPVEDAGWVSNQLRGYLPVKRTAQKVRNCRMPHQRLTNRRAMAWGMRM